jgi:DNA polymerase III epsilon subunit-like protein
MVEEKFLVIDTETTNSLDDPICYDIGFAVVNRKGEVYETHSYAVEEVYNYPDLMASAFYASKLPLYEEEISAGTRKIESFHKIRWILVDVLRYYNINIVAAHNARFDYRSLNLTQRVLTCSKFRYFFPYGVQIWDTLKMAREVLRKDSTYRQFCLDNGYTTKNRQNRFTAEVLYRFLTNNPDFKEAHIGLQDVLIEKEIFAYCLQQYPNIDGSLWGDKTDSTEKERG